MFNLRSSNTFWLNEQYLQGCTYLPFELLAFTGGKWLKDFPVGIVVTLSGIGRGEQKGHEFKASPAVLQIPVYIDKSFHAKIDNMVCVCLRMRMLVHTCYNFHCDTCWYFYVIILWYQLRRIWSKSSFFLRSMKRVPALLFLFLVSLSPTTTIVEYHTRERPLARLLPGCEVELWAVSEP